MGDPLKGLTTTSQGPINTGGGERIATVARKKWVKKKGVRGTNCPAGMETEKHPKGKPGAGGKNRAKSWKPQKSGGVTETIFTFQRNKVRGEVKPQAAGEYTVSVRGGSNGRRGGKKLPNF